jgi:hypothetical protein
MAEGNGRVKRIRLVATAGAHAECIGEPTGHPFGTRFAARQRLDCGAVIWRHLRRSTDREPQ